MKTPEEILNAPYDELNALYDFVEKREYVYKMTEDIRKTFNSEVLNCTIYELIEAVKNLEEEHRNIESMGYHENEASWYYIHENQKDEENNQSLIMV
jgi:hypothetical protein